MKKLPEDLEKLYTAVNVTKRPHEFSHFNLNILQQVTNQNISPHQRSIFAKIYSSNINENIKKFGINDADVFFSQGDIDYISSGDDDIEEYPSWVKPYEGEINLREETLLHFPYDKFDNLLAAIARHADSINQLILSVYRLADQSAIVRLVSYLLKVGVSVTLMLEINAKGNEESNIKYAHQLKTLGAQIIVSDSIKKTHAKFIHIIWDDNTDTSMVMTGNLNEVTANVYEDYCLITSNPNITIPMRSNIMRLITSLKSVPIKSDTVFFTQQNAVTILLREIKNQCDLGKKGRIVIKCNLFTDPSFMGVLEHAAECGCQVIIICRGECCFKPTNPNIETHRFIHKYLEHSRVYAFGRVNPSVYIGSLDIATHKLFGRFELICHIDDPNKAQSIMTTIDNMLNDNTERHYRLISIGRYHKYKMMEDK